MDVHAPHQPVHNWRDFAIHLTIVTIGLFIALSLEALVEYVHHRHLVTEARENIRTEIDANRKAAEDDLNLLQTAIDNTQANIETIHRLQANPKDFHGKLLGSMDFNSPDDAAFLTARDTGALSYMPYAEVQRYSDLYFLEELVKTKSITVGDSVFGSLTVTQMYTDMGNLPPDEVTNMLRANANALLQLKVLKQIVQEFDTACLAELKN
jgi:hypothetical protein